MGSGEVSREFVGPIGDVEAVVGVELEGAVVVDVGADGGVGVAALLGFDEGGGEEEFTEASSLQGIDDPKLVAEGEGGGVGVVGKIAAAS